MQSSNSGPHPTKRKEAEKSRHSKSSRNSNIIKVPSIHSTLLPQSSSSLRDCCARHVVQLIVVHVHGMTKLVKGIDGWF